jgi:hypothetical protein
LACPGIRTFPGNRTIQNKARTAMDKLDNLSMAMLFFVIADYGLIYKLIVQLGPKLTI